MQSVREYWMLIISTPFYVIIIGLELLLTHLQKQPAYTVRGTITNLYLMLLNSLIDLSFRIVYLAIFAFCYCFSFVQISNPWLYWLALLISEDFLYYWLHRFDHEIRLLWAVHVTHHSSKQMNFSVGFRSSVFEPLYRFVYFIPLAFLGFRPLDIVFMYSATQIWGTLVHTDMIGKLGWLEYIFVTPSHHRVHHASNVRYLDKNMGMFLIVWDKMFGTFQKELSPEEYELIRYGLVSDVQQPNAVNIVFHEWQGMVKDVKQKGLSWRNKVSYVLKAPGWSHDGSKLTSREMRKNQE